MSRIPWLVGFNPYSVGCCSGRIIQIATSTTATTFQSLFCWMLFWKNAMAPNITAHVMCFNPYSVGCCSGRAICSVPVCMVVWFQSLFCWMLFWKRHGATYVRKQLTVSILILLDVVLEVFRIILNKIETTVSILILLDVVLEEIGVLLYSSYKPVSILILLDVVLEVFWDFRNKLPLIIVSILILLDVVLEEIYAGDTTLANLQFQSLFCWMLFWKCPNVFFLNGATGRFNPYSVGCCSGSNGDLVLHSIATKFQSLFCWMLFWK